MVISIVIITGCISQQKENSTTPPIRVQQSSASASSQSFDNKCWIHIDPIRDFHTDSTGNITGSTILSVSGTTNIPSGIWMNLIITDETSGRWLLGTIIKVINNSSEQNTFNTIGFDMKGNPPGRYQVQLGTDSDCWAKSRFNITSVNDTSEVSSFTLIQMDPLEKKQTGKNILISGTTNFSAGTEITISYRMISHSCTPAPTPDQGGQRTFCGGSCSPGQGSSNIVRVVKGSGTVNSWNTTLNTTGWCMEIYDIGADAGNGTNSRHDGTEIRFFPS
jgi:hypothetical protein